MAKLLPVLFLPTPASPSMKVVRLTFFPGSFRFVRVGGSPESMGESGFPRSVVGHDNSFATLSAELTTGGWRTMYVASGLEKTSGGWVSGMVVCVLKLPRKKKAGWGKKTVQKQKNHKKEGRPLPRPKSPVRGVPRLTSSSSASSGTHSER